jgi:hypothetical protein
MDNGLTYCSFWVLSSCPMLEGRVHFSSASTNVQAYPEGWHKPEGTYFTFLCFFERRFSTLYAYFKKAIHDYKSAFVTVSEIKPTNFHHYSQLSMHSLVVLHSLKVMQSNRWTTAWGSFTITSLSSSRKYTFVCGSQSCEACTCLGMHASSCKLCSIKPVPEQGRCQRKG